jgi:hypothetical protein
MMNIQYIDYEKLVIYTTDHATWRGLYSDCKEHWKDSRKASPYHFPFCFVTKDVIELPADTSFWKIMMHGDMYYPGSRMIIAPLN